MTTKTTKRIRNTILIILGIYLFICTFLYFFQEGLIFPPAYRSDIDITDNSDIDTLEPLEVSMSDGCIMRGYRIRAVEPDSKNLLFYFGANAEDISSLPHKMVGFSDWNIILMNYRGYVDSDGEPSTDMLYQDAQEIYDSVLNEGNDYDNIVIMGRSIGSSVATCLASSRENSALILISPFDTMEHVVLKKCPILPVSLVLRNKFDSVKYAPAVTSPVYMLVGTKDWLVPNSLSMKLKEYFPGDVTYTEIPDVGHNTIDDVDEYWVQIQGFLEQSIQ